MFRRRETRISPGAWPARNCPVVRDAEVQLSHADLPVRAFLDEADTRNAAFVTWKLCANIVEKAAVDFTNKIASWRGSMS
ncbi:MAG TPA: hypothetical protein VI136_04695 [Verrucomicrobiae bacterium]